MGDVGDREGLSNPAAAGDIFSGYKAHCSAPRINTALAITEAIRAAHPDCTVTIIDADDCDFDGFAEAGHATLSLKSKGNRCLIQTAYRPPGTRMDEGPGKLNQSFPHACFEITWQGQTWILYTAHWTEEYMGVIRMNFVVSPSAASPEKLLLSVGKWSSELHQEIYSFDNARWKKNSKLWTAVQASKWEDVILDPTMKSTLIADVQDFFDSRALYEEYAVPWKRGIILHGTPGCGKTISIKALMNSLDKREKPVASLYVKLLKSNCETMQYSIRAIFSKAREMAPCLLVFEDLDSLITDELRSYFLNEVDGLEDNNGILMIGSTNHLSRLDPGISKRPSRFDRKYFYKIPGMRERILYCEYWKKKLEKNSNVDFDAEICRVVAELTEGFSFAYLKELFVQTLLTIVGGRQNQSEADEKEEEETTAGGAKVVPGSTKLAAGEEKVESTEDDEKAESTQTAGPEPPTVTIPDRLKSNSLMQVLHKQALALWKDMDNSNDEEAGVKVAATTTSEGT